MDKKYYLDSNGLVRVLQDISTVINQKTSSTIRVNEVTNPETGEVIKEVQNPNNFATVGAVHNYITNESRKKLTINQQSAVNISETNYDVQNNVSEYNGNEAAQIDINLIDINDIQQLFI